jgi:NADH dehydrogenase FAD-containing subunit
LNELLQQEVKRHFPHLAKYVTITIIQSQDHILNTFDSELSLYAEKKFLTEHINIITNARVIEVKQSELVIFDKNTKKTYSLPFGVCLWSTGIKRNPLVEVIAGKLGVQKSVNSLNCDPYMRVKGISQQNVYAIGGK